MKSYDPNRSQVEEIECSLCGRDGGPFRGCEHCHGNAGVQPRAYSLSDIRAGRAALEIRNEDTLADGGLPEHNPYS